MRKNVVVDAMPLILAVLLVAPQVLASDDLTTSIKPSTEERAVLQEEYSEEDKFSLSLDFDLVNEYVWRGHLFDRGISPQPSVTVGYALSERSSVELNAWWNVAGETHGSATHRDELFEQDFTFSFTNSFSDNFDLSLGYIYWSNPRSDVMAGTEAWQTDEIFLGVSYSSGNLTFGTTLYSDIDKVKGQYIDFSLATVYDLGEKLDLEISVNLGVSHNEAPNPDISDEVAWFLKDGLVEQSMGVALGYPLTEQVSFGVSVHYTSRMDGYKEATGESEKYLWGGLSLGYTF